MACIESKRMSEWVCSYVYVQEMNCLSGQSESWFEQKAFHLAAFCVDVSVVLVLFYTTAKAHQSVNKNLLPFSCVYSVYIFIEWGYCGCVKSFQFLVEWFASNQSDSCRITNHDEAPQSRLPIKHSQIHRRTLGRIHIAAISNSI